jgi:hypothetical protein
MNTNVYQDGQAYYIQDKDTLFCFGLNKLAYSPPERERLRNETKLFCVS